MIRVSIKKVSKVITLSHRLKEINETLLKKRLLLDDLIVEYSACARAINKTRIEQFTIMVSFSKNMLGGELYTGEAEKINDLSSECTSIARDRDVFADQIEQLDEDCRILREEEKLLSGEVVKTTEEINMELEKQKLT